MRRWPVLILDALFITRPILWIPVWGYFLLGYCRAVVVEDLPSPLNFTLWGSRIPVLFNLRAEGAFPALIMLTLAVASAYVLNQLADLKTDRENGGLPLIAKAGVSTGLAVAVTLALALIPLIFAVRVKGAVGAFLLITTFINVLYNARPFYFTGRPYLDFLSNAAGFGLVAFGVGWAAAAGLSGERIPYYLREALPYFLMMVAGSINSTIPDSEGDRKTGKITTVVRLGTRNANLLSMAALVLAAWAGFKNRDLVALLVPAVSLPFFLKYHVTQRMKDGLFTFQVCGSFLMVLTVILVPPFLIWGLLVYVATRLYFRKRHGVDYPVSGR